MPDNNRSPKNFENLVLEQNDKENFAEFVQRVDSAIGNSKCCIDKSSPYYNKERFQYIIKNILIIFNNKTYDNCTDKKNDSELQAFSDIIFQFQILILKAKQNWQFNLEIPDDIIQQVFNIIWIELSHHNENYSFCDTLFAFRNFILSISKECQKKVPTDIVQQVINLANREIEEGRILNSLDCMGPIEEFKQIIDRIPNNFRLEGVVGIGRIYNDNF